MKKCTSKRICLIALFYALSVAVAIGLTTAAVEYHASTKDVKEPTCHNT
jgi:hypothetical protein